MTTTEAIEEILKAKAAGQEIRFAETNPHWWMGCHSDGTLWWSYYCCDACENYDYEEFSTPEDLFNAADSGDADWVLVAPQEHEDQ